MTEEEENLNAEQKSNPFISKGLNKAIAILFVLGIFFIIFLKILFIE